MHTYYILTHCRNRPLKIRMFTKLSNSQIFCDFLLIFVITKSAPLMHMNIVLHYPKHYHGTLT